MTSMKIAVIIYTIFLLPLTTAAFCFEDAGAQFGVSPEILRTIAKEESDFNAIAINLNKNGTYDFGLMQINSKWVNILGLEAWLALREPCYNVKVGAWILSQCIRRYGYTWEAVGCYHSQGNISKKRYAWTIYNSLVNRKRSN